MISLKTINAAATKAVSNALERAELPHEMLAREVYENIPRPSAKLIFGETKTVRNGLGSWERECSLIAVWNAPNLERYKLDCLTAQEAIESYLLQNGVALPDGAVLPVLRTESYIQDAAVLVQFSVTAYGDFEEDAYAGDEGEPMERLESRFV